MDKPTMKNTRSRSMRITMEKNNKRLMSSNNKLRPRMIGMKMDRKLMKKTNFKMMFKGRKSKTMIITTNKSQDRNNSNNKTNKIRKTELMLMDQVRYNKIMKKNTMKHTNITHRINTEMMKETEYMSTLD